MSEEVMWLKNCWQVAAFAAEVTSKPLSRRLLNEPVVLWRTERGSPVAMYDRCPHRLVPLSAGRVVGERIRCGYHGMEFSPSGACVAIPGQSAIPAAACTKSYPVVERHQLFWIWMGDPALADPDLVPAVRWMDDPAWVPSTGYLHLKADYRLACDNLLDLSHEAYVHATSIGDTAIVETAPTVEVDDACVVRVHREMRNIEPPPFFQIVLGDNKGTIDRFQAAVYVPPGIHVTMTGVRPAGSSGSASEGRVMHLLTPETRTTTHYFWGMARNYRLDDVELTESIRQQVHRILDEDSAILEMQQLGKLEESDAPVPRVAIALDRGPIQGRRLLDDLIAMEKSGTPALRPVNIEGKKWAL